MQRGYFVSHQYEYYDNKIKYICVLLCWKDREIVGFLKNWTVTNESGSCFRRIQGYLIQIYRPKVIGHYNDNIGGLILWTRGD